MRTDPDSGRTPEQMDPLTDDLTAVAARLRLVIGRLYRRFSQDTAGTVSHVQLSLLASIARLAPVRLGDLAVHENLQPSSMTRSIAWLVDRNLVIRSVHPVDRRAVVVEPSAAGKILLDELWQDRTQSFAARLECLPPQDYDTLVAVIPLLQSLLSDLEPNA
jgi:DNA-binding MarR family transcriptional regulator